MKGPWRWYYTQMIGALEWTTDKLLHNNAGTTRQGYHQSWKKKTQTGLHVLISRMALVLFVLHWTFKRSRQSDGVCLIVVLGLSACCVSAVLGVSVCSLYVLLNKLCDSQVSDSCVFWLCQTWTEFHADSITIDAVVILALKGKLEGPQNRSLAHCFPVKIVTLIALSVMCLFG